MLIKISARPGHFKHFVNWNLGGLGKGGGGVGMLLHGEANFQRSTLTLFKKKTWYIYAHS